MRVIDFFDPRIDLNTWNNFNKLKPGKKAITWIVSAIAAVIFPIYGGFVAFRALTYHFTEIKPRDQNPLSKQTEPTQIVTRPLLNPDPEPVKAPKPQPKPMAEWKQKIYQSFEKQLKAIDLKSGDAEESGDCFFDSVAQQLNHRTHEQEKHTKKTVRQKLKKHLDQCTDDRYEKLLKGNGDGYTYDHFCKYINKCVEDLDKDAPAPIWGNNVTLQLVADAFNVTVISHNITTVQREVQKDEDTQYNGWDYEDEEIFEDQNTKDVDMQGWQESSDSEDDLDGEGWKDCVTYHNKKSGIIDLYTLLNEETFEPFKKEVEPLDTIQLGTLQRGPWGHFVPVFPL